MGGLLSYYLKQTYSSEPYIITFGAPPAFHKDEATCELLPSDNQMFSFVNLNDYDTGDEYSSISWAFTFDDPTVTVMDPAVSVGFDVNSAHPNHGFLVVLSGHSDNIYIKQNPNDDLFE